MNVDSSLFTTILYY